MEVNAVETVAGGPWGPSPSKGAPPAFILGMLSYHTAPFDFYFQVAIVRRYLDLVGREINFATLMHALASKMTTVENVFCTRFTGECLDYARGLAHLYSKTSTTVS